MRTAAKSWACTVLWSVLHAGAALAQEQPGLLVLEVPASTESMAYGNAPWLFSTDAALLFYSPALLERSEGVSAGYAWFGDAGVSASLAGAGEGLGGGFAAGLQVMRYETELGGPSMQDLQGDAFLDGAVGVSELVGSIGYARTLLGVRAGATIKLAHASLDASDDRGLLADVGLARDVGPLLIGLAARNLGTDLDTRPDPDPLADPNPDPPPTQTGLRVPRQLVAGLSTEQFEVGPFDLFLTSQVTWRRDDEVIPAGGLELSYWPVQGYTFRLRAGAQRTLDPDRSPVTLGAAFTGDHITIEYAFQSFDGLGNLHRFGLRWR